MLRLRPKFVWVKVNVVANALRIQRCYHHEQPYFSSPAYISRAHAFHKKKHGMVTTLEVFLRKTIPKKGGQLPPQPLPPATLRWCDQNMYMYSYRSWALENEVASYILMENLLTPNSKYILHRTHHTGAINRGNGVHGYIDLLLLREVTMSGIELRIYDWHPSAQTTEPQIPAFDPRHKSVLFQPVWVEHLTIYLQSGHLKNTW